jgi:hypothetical protein
MGLGAALKSVLTKFNFQMDGGKLAAINVAAGKTDARFAKAANSAEVLQNRMGSLFKKAAMLGGALLGGLGVKSLTSDFANQAVEADRMSKSLGVSLEFYGGLQHALESVNIPGEETSQVIADISERMFDAAGQSKALQGDFAMIGLTLGKLKEAAKGGPEAQIYALADAMQQAGPGAERTFVAMSGLGDVGKRLLPLLDQGSAGLKKYIKEAKQLGVILDKDAIKQAKIFNKRMVVMKARIRGARNAIAMRLLPAVNDMVAGFSTWIASTENQTKLLYALGVAAGVAAIAIASMLAPRILAGFKVFVGQLRKILTLLKGINLQMVLMSAKILAVVAAAAFLGLVIEDLVAFVRGDKSVTEQLFGRSQVIIDGLLSIRDTFMEMLDSLGESFGTLWGSIVELADAFGIKLTSFKALLVTIGKIIFMAVVAALIVVGNVLTGILWGVGKIIEAVNFLVRLLVDGLLGAINAVKWAWTDLGEEISALMQRIEDAVFVTAHRTSAFFQRAADLATAAWRKFSSFLDRVKNKAVSIAGRLKNIALRRTETLEFVPPTGGPTASPAGGKGNTVTATTNVGGIVINGAGKNPKEIGKEVVTQLQGTITGTYRDLVPDTAGSAGESVFD